MHNTLSLIKDILDNEYKFIKNIKRTDTEVFNVLENNYNKQRVLVKYFKGNADVYKMLLGISHENIPIVYEAVTDDDICIVIEEYIDGVTVGEVLETGLYTSDGVYEVVRGICEALRVLHSKGIVHRDIKPENVMITKEGCVKLIDFDISRVDKDNNSKDTEILGTMGFASPEQYGISATNAKSDIYSIGILINVMLTGEHPSKRICSGKWQRIVNKCTRINPDERFRSVDELIKNMK